MSKIHLKIDGKRYNLLIEKHEKQLVDLAALGEYEKQASKACVQVVQQYESVNRNNATANRQLAELLAERHIADEKYKQATERCSALIDDTARTVIDIVVELIHDNIDMLNGMDINDKQAFLAINEALPDDIFVDTNMGERDTVLHVHSGNRNKRVRRALQRIDSDTHINCCNKQGHFIDKKRFLSDYANGKYGNTAR
jgi:hypothetical protein